MFLQLLYLYPFYFFFNFQLQDVVCWWCLKPIFQRTLSDLLQCIHEHEASVNPDPETRPQPSDSPLKRRQQQTNDLTVRVCDWVLVKTQVHEHSGTHTHTHPEVCNKQSHKLLHNCVWQLQTCWPTYPAMRLSSSHCPTPASHTHAHAHPLRNYMCWKKIQQNKFIKYTFFFFHQTLALRQTVTHTLLPSLLCPESLLTIYIPFSAQRKLHPSLVSWKNMTKLCPLPDWKWNEFSCQNQNNTR